MASLVVFIVVAHVTDGMYAVVDRTPLSRAGIQDLFKSSLIFILVGIGNILDANVLTNTPTMRTTIILYYFSVEGLTILENTVHLGLPIPERLREALEQMRPNQIESDNLQQNREDIFCNCLSPNRLVLTYILYRDRLCHI